jgi:hypothetical protein
MGKLTPMWDLHYVARDGASILGIIRADLLLISGIGELRE